MTHGPHPAIKLDTKEPTKEEARKEKGAKAPTNGQVMDGRQATRHRAAPDANTRVVANKNRRAPTTDPLWKNWKGTSSKGKAPKGKGGGKSSW